MAISFVQQKSGGAVNAGAITLTFDAGMQVNDLILVIHCDGDTTDNAMPTPTTAGYTDVGTSEQYANSTVDCNSRAWYKFHNGTDTNCVLAGTGGGTNCGTSGALMVFRGVATVAQGGPFSTAIVKTTGTGSTSADSPSIATTATDWVVSLVAAAHATTMGTYTAPANYTTNANLGTAGNDTNASRAGMAYRASGFSNPEDPPAWSMSSTSANDSWCAITAALKEAPPVTTALKDVIGGGVIPWAR